MTPSPARLSSLEREWTRRKAAAAARRAAAMAEAGRRRLADFIRAAWPQVEPGRPLVWGRHLDAMCEHLEAVTAGQIQNLVIEIPPGCTKSRLVGVFWPCWEWLRAPETRWLFFSNSDDLATRESLACRRLWEGDWAATHYPDAVRITTDQNTKTWYENERAGHRHALSIGANATGKKADRLVVDDANDAEKVQGAANRTAVNSRWDNAIYDRVIDFKASSRVLVGQRTHRDDLIGHVKAAGSVDVLTIPEQFERARRTTTSIGWTDWRRDDGEFLRPDQFGPAEAEQAKRRLGSMGYRAKHQQDPQSPEGVLFKAAWLARRWRRDPDSPDLVVLDDERGPYRFNLAAAERFLTADGAASARTSADPTVICAWAVTPRGDLLWLDCRRHWAEIPDQSKLLADAAAAHHPKAVGVEAVASNRGLFQFAQRLGLAAVPMTPSGLDKLSHAQGGLIHAEQGQLWLPDPAAAPTFPFDAVLSELLAFTGTAADAHDDIVDTLSYAVDLKPRFCRPAGPTVLPAVIPTARGTPVFRPTPASAATPGPMTVGLPRPVERWT